MSDASAVAASSLNWIQQAQNNPVEFLKNLDDLLDDFGSQELGNALTQQYIGKFIESLREQINNSDLPQGVKDAANALLDAHAAGVRETCPCSAEASEAVASTSQSETVNQSAEAAAEEAAEAANEGTAASGNSAVEAAVEANQNFEEDVRRESEGKNWLEILAENLAEIQAKFLNKALAASDVMAAESGNAAGEGDNSGTPSTAFLEAQAQFTANMQLFNLFANQSATALKTIGEGLAGVARKQ